MRRVLKSILLGLAALALIAVAGIGLAINLINPNDLKPRLESLVLQSTGRSLNLQGDLSFSLLPRISLEAGPAELQHEALFGPGPFVRVEKIQASLKLVPLLTGTVDIEELTLSGLQVNLVVNKAGHANWESQPKAQSGGVVATPLAPESQNDAVRKAQAPLPAIDSLQLDNTLIRYADLRDGKEWSLALPQINLDNVTPGKKTTLEILARYERPAVKQTLALSFQASFMLPASVEQKTYFTLAGKLDKTEFSGKGDLTFQPDSSPRVALNGEFRMVNLDLDSYLDAGAGAGKEKSGMSSTPTAGDNARQAKDEAEGVRSVQNLALDLSLAADTVTVSRLPLRAIEATVKADKGRFSIPAAFTLAGGSATVTADIDASGTRIATRVKGELRNAQAAQIVQALSGKDTLSGNLNLNWDVRGQGLSWPVLARSLAGKAALNMTQGRVPAFQIIPEGIPGVAATRMDIHIERLNATWNIAKGIARNNDLVMQGRMISATGGGTCNLAEQIMDYRVNISLPTLLVVPAIISGPLASPQYSVDSVRLLRGTAKGILESPSKVEQGIGKFVKDIFEKKQR